MPDTVTPAQVAILTPKAVGEDIAEEKIRLDADHGAEINAFRSGVDLAHDDGRGIGALIADLEARFERGERHFVLNLRAVSGLSKDEIKGLMRLHDRCSRATGMLGLCELKPEVADFLRIADVSLAVYPREQDALKEAAARLKALLERERRLADITVQVHEVTLGENLSGRGFLEQAQGSAFVSRLAELVVLRMGTGTKGRLADTMQVLIDHGLHNVVIDLEETAHLDADRVGELERALNALETWGGGLALVRAPEPARELLREMGLDQALPVFAGVDEVVSIYKERLLEIRAVEESGRLKAVRPGQTAPDPEDEMPDEDSELMRSDEHFLDGPPPGAAPASSAAAAVSPGVAFQPVVSDDEPDVRAAYDEIAMHELVVSPDDLGGLAQRVADATEQGHRHFAVRLTGERNLRTDELNALSEAFEAGGDDTFLSVIGLSAPLRQWFHLMDLERQFGVSDDAEGARKKQARALAVARRRAAAEAQQRAASDARKKREWQDLLEKLPEIEREPIALAEGSADEGRLVYRAREPGGDGRRERAVTIVDVDEETFAALPDEVRQLIESTQDDVLVNLHGLGSERAEKRLPTLVAVADDADDRGRVCLFCEPSAELRTLVPVMGYDSVIRTFRTETDGLAGIARAHFDQGRFDVLELRCARLRIGVAASDADGDGASAAGVGRDGEGNIDGGGRDDDAPAPSEAPVIMPSEPSESEGELDDDEGEADLEVTFAGSQSAVEAKLFDTDAELAAVNPADTHPELSAISTDTPSDDELPPVPLTAATGVVPRTPTQKIELPPAPSAELEAFAGAGGPDDDSVQSETSDGAENETAAALGRMKRELEEARARAEELEKKASDTDAELQALRDVEEEARKLRQELDERQKELEAAGARLDARDADVERLEKQLAEVRDGQGAREADLDKARSRLEQLEKEKNEGDVELERIRRRAEDLEQSVSGREEEIDHLKGELEELQKTVRGLEAKALEGAPEEVRTEFDAFRERADSEARALKERIDELKKTVENREAEGLELVTRLEEADQATTLASNERDGLRERNEKLEKEMEELRARLADVQQFADRTAPIAHGAVTQAIAVPAETPAGKQPPAAAAAARAELVRLRVLEIALREKLAQAQWQRASFEAELGARLGAARDAVQRLERDKAEIIADAKHDIERLQHEQQVLREELESAGEMIERLGKELELS